MSEVRKKAGKKNHINIKIQKAKSKFKEKKSKEKQIVFAPRSRLEPRLSLPSSEKNNKKQEAPTDVEETKKLVISLNANEVEDHIKHNNLKVVSNSISPSSDRNTVESNEVSHVSSISPLNKKNHSASLKDMDDFGDEEIEDCQNFIKQARQRVTKGMYWTDREIKDLSYALQYHGFGDMKKIAAEVKTKSENDIRTFVKTRVIEKRREKTQHVESDRHRGRPPNTWKTVSPENLKTWPTIRKWKRLAYEQMLLYTRSKDYSRPVISALCKKFEEEEPEPDDPQVINVKLIYKYMSDCMAGVIPPQLPPKESALVLDLLREVRLMPMAYDFEEEREFFKDFRKATTFKPFEVKDEFKKKLKKDPDANDSNTVSVPEEIFLELSRHKRLLQSFNPMITPVWMVQKEQEHLENYFKESSVYVD